MEGKFNNKCDCNSCIRNETSTVQKINTNLDHFRGANIRYEHRINTSDVYQTNNLPIRFEHTYLFSGYGCQYTDRHPAYRTSSSDYGWMPPNAHTVSQRYYPKSSEFSTLQSLSGMYRNYSLNTSMDKS